MLQLIKKAKDQPFIKNLALLIADRSMQLMGQLFNIFLLTKYLGPSNFGILMYSLSIYGFLLSVSNVGMDRVLVVELSGKTDNTEKNNILLSGIFIKLTTSLVLLGIIVLGKPITGQFFSTDVLPVFTLLSWSLLLTLWQIIDVYNQSSGSFKNTAIARITSVVVIIIFKAILIWKKASFMLIVAAFTTEQLLCLLLSIAFSPAFLKQLRTVKFADFKFQKKMLSSGFLVLISTVCIIVYMRTSQVIIENRFSKVYLGLFSLVVYLVEMPISLASVMSTLFTPKLAMLSSEQDPKAFQTHLARIFLFFISISFLSAVILIAVGAVLSFILGTAYTGFYTMMLEALPSIPLIFIGYYAYMVMLSSKKFKQYLTATLLGGAGALLYLYFARNYYTTANAVYLYVLSQFIATFLVPIILQAELRESIKQCFVFVTHATVFAELKAVNHLFKKNTTL